MEGATPFGTANWIRDNGYIFMRKKRVMTLWKNLLFSK
jgi:hypothetical protein